MHNMATDWKDILGSLDLPHGENNNEDVVSETGKTVEDTKKVTLFYERKGRAGKSVTILADFTGVTDEDIKQLASELKRQLGCGGSVDGGEILIQGDRRADLKKLLTQHGYKVKGA